MKEFNWSLTVDGASHSWTCGVTDTYCAFFEDGQERGRLEIQNPEKKQGVLQLDEAIEVFGEQFDFQLENGIPYLRIDGRWTMSETTRLARREKLLYNQKVTGLTQVAVAAVIALVYLVGCRFFPGWKERWFVLVMASFFALVGVSQFFTARKALREAALSIDG